MFEIVFTKFGRDDLMTLQKNAALKKRLKQLAKRYTAYN